jgi:hypothetical protein
VNIEKLAECLFGKNGSVFEIPQAAKMAVGFHFPDLGEYLFEFSENGEVEVSCREHGKPFESFFRVEYCTNNKESDCFFKQEFFGVFYANLKMNIIFSAEKVSRIWFE